MVRNLSQGGVLKNTRHPRRRGRRLGVTGRGWLAAFLLMLALLPAAQSATTAPSAPLPYRDAKLPVDQRVADLLGRMSLEEKIGQMTQAERGAVAGDPDQIRALRLGSVLSGGGSTP